MRTLEWVSLMNQDNWKILQDKDWILTLESKRKPNLNDVSLILQFSINRFDRFENILKRWKGPISVVVYLINPWDIYDFWSYYYSYDELKFENVTFTLFKPNYADDFEDYPINKVSSSSSFFFCFFFLLFFLHKYKIIKIKKI